MADEYGHPSVDEMRIGDVLAAVADDNRRHVVRELALSDDTAERSCTSFGLDVSKSTRSHHFKVLREAGVVRQVDRGNKSGVTLRRDDLERRFPGLLELIAAEER
ncbi:ArsR/SmtB family transcription factor [Dietzia timorensis]|uniref:Putative HTH-type transcriptional regulator YczG n=1 Tax=Dietzia timorensis TaxID=499555 RepID=A0A173LNY1_9ACTN|nr:ArsR family transcriptional regulator [Dietzia timorensis]ANI93995.1 putative HTH-type transcriptional regulator YczG [Dietzia timorensis]